MKNVTRLILAVLIVLSLFSTWSLGQQSSPPFTAVNYGGATHYEQTAPIDFSSVTANAVNGVYSYTNFGIKCDGVTDDSFGLNLIGSQAPAAGYVVSFPSNAVCIHASSITTWAKPNLRILGNGARLKFTGSGKQIDLQSGAAEVDNIAILDLVLQGNASATHNIYSSALIARSTFRILEAQDVTTACFELQNFELDNLDLSCSTNKATTMGVAQTTVPQSGLIAGGDITHFFANNRIVKITMEGVSGSGLWCKHCTNFNHFVGTSEGNAVGITTDPNSSGNIYALDLESNSSADANIGSYSETFVGMTSLGTFNALSGSGGSMTGLYQTVNLQAGHASWIAQNVIYNSVQTSGTFTGMNPLLDVIVNVCNRVGGVCLPGSTIGGQTISMPDGIDCVAHPLGRNWKQAATFVDYGQYDLMVSTACGGSTFTNGIHVDRNAKFSADGGVSAPSYSTVTNCASSTGACSAASAGMVSIAASGTTRTIATTAVTANSEIFVQEDSSLGTALGVTCNTTTGRIYTVTARTAGTSFVITSSAAPTTNPACVVYRILN